MTSTSSKPTILIIDDELIHIKILQSALEAEYKIDFATTGFDGLKIAVKNTLPDLILLDIVMPGMDGYQVCQKLKEDDRTKNIPVIFITVKGEEEYEARGFAAGAVDYMAKPFNPNIVKCRVKAHISLKLAMEKVNFQNGELQEAQTDLEKKVAARTLEIERTNRSLQENEERLRNYARELEEANTTLRVVMNRQSAEQKAMEEKFQQNINKLVIPYLQKLEDANLDDQQVNYLSILKTNLNSIMAPFYHENSINYANLTPQEIQVADLIRQGKHTKEVADILCISAHTIASHRNNIRKKMNLNNSKTNLCSFLQSLK